MNSFSSKALLAFLILQGSLAAQGAPTTLHSIVQKEGFVPNQDVAIQIAEAVLAPIYGAESIAEQKPYKVDLTNNVWTVSGTLPHNMRGGVFLIQLSKKDARIIRITHGQ